MMRKVKIEIDWEEMNFYTNVQMSELLNQDIFT